VGGDRAAERYQLCPGREAEPLAAPEPLHFSVDFGIVGAEPGLDPVDAKPIASAVSNVRGTSLVTTSSNGPIEAPTTRARATPSAEMELPRSGVQSRLVTVWRRSSRVRIRGSVVLPSEYWMRQGRPVAAASARIAPPQAIVQEWPGETDRYTGKGHVRRAMGRQAPTSYATRLAKSCPSRDTANGGDAT
jgi:hypothetical protein